jgi:hypothetical protein
VGASFGMKVRARIWLDADARSEQTKAASSAATSRQPLSPSEIVSLLVTA